MVKESFLEMAKRHQAGNMLVQGEWKTCSVGCFNRDYGNKPNDIAALAKSTGYPVWVHRLQERIFEYLPKNCALDWHVQFAEKMLTIKNFDALYHSFMIGVLEVALPHDKYGVVQPVIDLHRNYQNATPEDWKEVRAAADAAWAAAKAAADAAWDVAVTAAWAEADAARARAEAAARAQAWAGAAARAAAGTAVDAVDAAWTAAWVAADAAGAARGDAWQKISDAFLNAYGGE